MSILPGNMNLDNQAIYNSNWQSWLDMKVHGPASRWLRSLIQKQLQEIPDPAKICSVLDVGCGEGTVTHMLAERFPQARTIGVDFSETGIACANARYARENLQFIHEIDAVQLEDPHDLVTAFEVLEHVEDWRSLLQRMLDSAQQFLMLSFPTGRMRPFERHIGHFRNFVPGEVERFVFERGFDPAAIWYAGFPFFSPLYRDLCNATQAQGDSFVMGTYGPGRKMLSSAIYPLFRFLSTRRRLGDQFCGLFARKGG